MNDYKNKDLFQQDAVDKQLSIAYDGGVITNSDLYSGEFELRESLCSGSELKFGACEASTLKIKVANVIGSLKNKELTVTEVLNGDKEAPFSYGKYKVYSDVPSGDRTYRTITAYDAMYDIVNMDVAAWYNSIKLPLSLKKMRDSFFNYMGITQVETSLVNDAMTVEETISSTTISGKTIISSICELNGVFGHMNRDGKFEYVRLTQKAAGLYPAVDLYPSKQLYPMEDKSETVKKSNYIDVEYEDYKTQPITKLQIRDKEGDIGAVVGSGSNCYIVQSNILTYGKSAEELATVAKNLYDAIKDITYRPFKATMKGRPDIEVGKAIRINSKRQVIESYVLTRTLKGIQALRDSMQASGVYEYAEKVNSINEQINQLRGKTNTLVRNVEETQSTLEDVATGLQSQITQTAEAISSEVSRATGVESSLDTKITQTSEQITLEISKKVGKDEVISRINQSAESIEIAASKLNLNGAITANGNVTIDEQGKIHAKNGEFEGNITSSNAHITKGYMTISGDHSSPEGSVPSALVLYGATVPTPDSVSLTYKGLVFNSNELSGSTSVELLYSRDLVFYTGANKSSWGTWIDETGVWSPSLTISGTKSRVVDTENYDKRLLYCYEMPCPIFGDIGHGIIGSDGLCYVDIDNIFSETIDTVQQYFVFLQSYSENNLYVKEKHTDYFVVKGKPNTEFDWEIKAKQSDFNIERLEEYSRDDYVDIDYLKNAIDYLGEYERSIVGDE